MNNLKNINIKAVIDRVFTFATNDRKGDGATETTHFIE